MGIFKVARAVTREVSNARGKCPGCGGELINPWPAYPGASHSVCGNCAVR